MSIRTLLTVVAVSFSCAVVALAGGESRFPDPACQRAAADVGSAIQSAGSSISKKQLSQIVFNAVRTSPQCVLAIVHSAALASPLEAAPQVVNAATSALPNPWKQVSYRRLITRPLKHETSDFKNASDGSGLDLGGRAPGANGERAVQAVSPDNGASFDGKSGGSGGGERGVAKASGYGTNSGVWPSWTSGGEPIYGGEISYGPYPWGSDDAGAGSGADGSDGASMSLAEAIVQAAFDARPGSSSRTLVSAADTALLMSPIALMRSIDGIGSLSAVGDDGISNYGNEPRRFPPQGVLPIPVPQPPVVSQ